MKLTKPEHIEALQLIPGVRPTESESDTAMNPHESAFVDTFVVASKRSRWRMQLGDPRKRWQALHRLADTKDLDRRHLSPIPKGSQSPEAIAQQLRSLGAPEQAFVISEFPDVDGQALPLAEALAQVVGGGVGSVVSCLPGRLAYHEAEVLGMRNILRAPRSGAS